MDVFEYPTTFLFSIFDHISVEFYWRSQDGWQQLWADYPLKETPS